MMILPARDYSVTSDIGVTGCVLHIGA